MQSLETSFSFQRSRSFNEKLHLSQWKTSTRDRYPSYTKILTLKLDRFPGAGHYHAEVEEIRRAYELTSPDTILTPRAKRYSKDKVIGITRKK